MSFPGPTNVKTLTIVVPPSTETFAFQTTGQKTVAEVIQTIAQQLNIPTITSDQYGLFSSAQGQWLDDDRKVAFYHTYLKASVKTKSSRNIIILLTKV